MEIDMEAGYQDYLRAWNAMVTLLIRIGYNRDQAEHKASAIMLGAELDIGWEVGE